MMTVEMSQLVPLHRPQYIDLAIARLTGFTQRLEALMLGGLLKHEAFALLANFVNGAVTYSQRAAAGDPALWKQFDDKIVDILGGWLGSQLSPLSRRVLFLPAKLGGAGLASAELRTDPAYVASWHAAEEAVLQSQGIDTLEQSELKAPCMHAAVRAARERIVATGGSMRVPSQKAMT